MKKFFIIITMLIFTVSSFAEVNCYLKNDTMYVEFSIDRYKSEFGISNDKNTGFNIILPDCEKMFKFYKEHEKDINYIYTTGILNENDFKEFKKLSTKNIRKRKNIIRLYELFGAVQVSEGYTYYNTTRYGNISLKDYAHPINVPVKTAWSYKFIRRNYKCKKE